MEYPKTALMDTGGYHETVKCADCGHSVSLGRTIIVEREREDEWGTYTFVGRLCGECK